MVMTRDELRGMKAEEFYHAVKEMIRLSREEMKYTPIRTIQMLRRKSAYKVVEHLVKGTSIKEGFRKVMLAGRPYLTAEYLVVKYENLFDEDTVENCRKRLAMKLEEEKEEQ
jgi:hypothetical protein